MGHALPGNPMFLMVIGTLNVEPISESFPFIIFIIKLKKLYLSGKAREQHILYESALFIFFHFYRLFNFISYNSIIMIFYIIFGYY